MKRRRLKEPSNKSPQQAHDVEEVLRALDIDPNDRERIVEVWNKLDRLTPDARAQLDNVAARRETRPVLVSALTGEGLDGLTRTIEGRLGLRRTVLDLLLDPADGAGVSWLHRHAEVMTKSLDDQGRLAMTVRVDSGKADAVRAKFPSGAFGGRRP